MVSTSPGTVVLVPFPFSDLSRSKLRPALVIADADRGNWILCQITGKPYGDPRTVALPRTGFSTGSLPLDSYIRPAKLFTANAGLITHTAGRLDAVLSKRSSTPWYR